MEERTEKKNYSVDERLQDTNQDPGENREFDSAESSGQIEDFDDDVKYNESYADRAVKNEIIQQRQELNQRHPNRVKEKKRANERNFRRNI